MLFTFAEWLHYAAERNHVQVAKLLIAHSANVNITDWKGQTALHYAAWDNNIEVAKLLIAHSANLNATAVSGYEL